MPYPTIADIFNMARIEINDAFKGATQTQGEGRIFINTWPPIITHLNEAIYQFKRDIENFGGTTKREETFYTAIPIINSSAGSGVPNPSVYQYLSFDGFWDGLGPLNVAIKLPTDLIAPLEVQTRATGSNLTYGRIDPAVDGLPSVYQDYTLGQWEWRGDSIYWNGSTVQQDIRLRYEADISTFATTLDPSTFDTVTVPYLDCAQPLALYCAYIFCSNKLPTGGANDLLARYNSVMSRIANRYSRQKQRTAYARIPYGTNGDIFGWGG